MANIKGIDVSKYQGDIDFNKVKADGVNFVIIRAGYGRLISQKDPKFEQNYSRAKDAGLNVGAYWYSYAKTAEDAKTEAEVFAKVLEGKQLEYPAYLDIEDATQKSSAIANAVVPAFLETLEGKGFYAGLYSYYYFFKDFIDDKYEKRYTVWLAQYASSTSYTGHKIWQYSSSGQVAGISGRVDMNWSSVDFGPVVKASGRNGWTASSVKEETATPAPTVKVTADVGTTEASSVKTFLTNGAKVKLVDDNVYSSASETKNSIKKTGTFFIYSNDVINGRVRITNEASRVGKAPAGANVTGWVDILFVEEIKATATPVTPTPAPVVTQSATSGIKAGQKITLSNTTMYSSATSKNSAGKKTGTYWIYSDDISNGRVRITNNAGNVGKKPIGNYVTGWISVSDVK